MPVHQILLPGIEEADIEPIQTCGECGRELDENDIEEINGLFVGFGFQTGHCPECIFTCEDCGSPSEEPFEATNANDYGVCDECAGEYFTCEDCGSTFPNDYSHIYNDCCLCSSCYDSAVENDEQENELIHDYGYKPYPKFLSLPGEATKEYFGLEIEVDKGGEADSAVIDSGLDRTDRFYCKHDSSLDDGFEIVSEPGTYRFWMENENFDFCPKLTKLGYRSYNTDTCGIHIHVSRKALTDTDIAKLLLFMKRNAGFVLYFSRRRESDLNHWAGVNERPMHQMIQEIKRMGVYSQRYSAINLLPGSTIEFRMFRGTLNVAAIKRNIGIVAAMIGFARETKAKDMTVSAFRSWLVSESAIRRLGFGMSVCLSFWVSRFIGAN